MLCGSVFVILFHKLLHSFDCESQTAHTHVNKEVEQLIRWNCSLYFFRWQTCPLCSGPCVNRVPFNLPAAKRLNDDVTGGTERRLPLLFSDQQIMCGCTNQTH